MTLQRRLKSFDRNGLVSTDQFLLVRGEINLRTEPFTEESEVTGHPLAHLAVSIQAKGSAVPSEMDIFLTIRHYDQVGKESQ